MKKKIYTTILTLLFFVICRAQKIDGFAGFLQLGYEKIPSANRVAKSFFPGSGCAFDNKFFHLVVKLIIKMASCFS